MAKIGTVEHMREYYVGQAIQAYGMEHPAVIAYAEFCDKYHASEPMAYGFDLLKKIMEKEME